MDEESRLAMYEAQAIAIEKQLEIDRLKEGKEAEIEKLKREKDDLLELMRRLAKTETGKSTESHSKIVQKPEIERLSRENEELTERVRKLEQQMAGKQTDVKTTISVKSEQLPNKGLEDVWAVVNGFTGQLANLEDQFKEATGHITRLQNEIEEKSIKLWKTVNDSRQPLVAGEKSTYIKLQNVQNIRKTVGFISTEKCESLQRQSLDELKAALGNKNYFFDDKLTSADIEIFAQVSSIYYLPKTDDIVNIPNLEYPTLVAWMERVKQQLDSKGFRSCGLDKLEKEKDTVLIIANDKKEDSHMLVLSADRTKWIELKFEPPFCAWTGGAAYLNGEIYIFGGQMNLTALYKLDKNFKWIRLADMNVGRHSFTKSCFEWNGYIWVFGGIDDNSKRLKSVERYDPKEDKWTLMPEMKYARSGGAVAFANGGIIISGGRTDDGVISYVEYFNLQNNCWTELPNMPSALIGHSLVAYNNKLITIGGYDRKSAFYSMWELDLQKINRQPSAKWNPLPPLKNPIFSFVGTILDEEIYAIGGRQGLGQDLNRVNIFDGKNWRDGPALPYPICDMLAVIIPQTLANRLFKGTVQT